MPATFLWQCPFIYLLTFSIPCLPQQMNIHFSILKLMDQFVFKNHVFNNMICYKNKHFTNKLHKAKHQFLQLKSFQHVTVHFPPSLTWVPQCLLYHCDHQQWRVKKKKKYSSASSATALVVHPCGGTGAEHAQSHYLAFVTFPSRSQLRCTASLPTHSFALIKLKRKIKFLGCHISKSYSHPESILKPI